MPKFPLLRALTLAAVLAAPLVPTAQTALACDADQQAMVSTVGQGLNVVCIGPYDGPLSAPGA